MHNFTAAKKKPDPPAPRQPAPFTTLELVAISALMRASVYPHKAAMYEAFRSAHQKINDALGVR
jgi:hypothetical protein